MDEILALILAGGQGERLSILVQERAKPAVPFGGKYRIIDFTLSNCVNSGIRNVFVLTQYNPLSLAEHVGVGAPWGLIPPDKVIRMLQPYLAKEEGRDWYKGTADAVYQNLQHIEQNGAALVLILSGDHIYKMDYSAMFEFHKERQADVTIAITPMPEETLKQFGTVATDESGRVTGFQEKVAKPRSNLANMGIYLFKTEVLKKYLEEDAGSSSSKHDFGKDIFPKIVADKNHRLFAYNFNNYWHDVGTVRTYWQTNMDLLDMSPSFLSKHDWPIRTKEDQWQPSMISDAADVTNSLMCDGCIIEGHVEHSILSTGVRIAKGAVVKDSIIMSDSVIGRNSVIDYSIIDKEVVVEADCHIGFSDNFQGNRKQPKLVNTGITLIGKRARIHPGTKIGRNCVVYGGSEREDFPGLQIESGETIKPKKRRLPS